MALNIRNAEAHQLAAELAALAGEPKTDAVICALRERLVRLRQLHSAGEPMRGGLADRLDRVAMPVLINSSAEFRP
jgi:antitoxin VapB